MIQKIEWMKVEVLGTNNGLSDNGWIDMELLSSGTSCVMLEQVGPYSFCLMDIAPTITLKPFHWQ